ncbi:MAG: alkaline phosphatase D family protein [Pseudomonadota bacterium]
MQRITRRRLAALAGLGVSTPLFGATNRPTFQHGVASGDPLADRVVLWSRVSGYRAPVEVTVTVATDVNLTRVVRRIETTTDASRDYTIKVDADGLAPGQRYYYNFATADVQSPTGRTKTLAVDGEAAVRLAVVSCANYPAGFFNVYRAIGNDNSLDAVVHLGDYLYEYPADGYASSRAEEFGRLSVPLQEVVALADYRQRYAQYRSDPDLQYVHAQLPFIAIWDDHEITNDAWTGGAQNHQPNEGDYGTRRDAAMQVYREWMPIRDQAFAYRRFDFGQTATLAMLETRLAARSEPLSYGSDLDPIKRVFTSAEGPVELPVLIDPTSDKTIEDPARIEALLASGQRGKDYRFEPDIDRFIAAKLSEPSRELVGSQQMAWLEEICADPDAGHWFVLGNQTLMSEVRAPNMMQALTASERARIPGYLQPLLPLTRYGIPMNLDAWDGYPADRERVFDRLARRSNNVVLAGDSHNAWAAPLTSRTGAPVGHEIATPSVSSPGIQETMALPAARIETLFRDANPHLAYTGFSYRGYVELALTPAQAVATYYGVNRIDERRFALTQHHRVILQRM